MQKLDNQLSEVTPWETEVEVGNGTVVEDVIIQEPPTPSIEVIPNEGNAGSSHHPQKPSRPVKKYDAVDKDENPVEDIIEEEEDELPTQNPSRSLKAEQYNAIIEATKKIKLGTSGTLKVWIGLEKYIPKQNPNFERDSTTWYSYSGTYARITPVAKNFIIEPDEPIVLRIDQTGSGFQYAITPQERGEFEVSALIELFDNEECLGHPVIKPTQVLSVKVEVGYLDEIWAPVWSNFTRFWGAFVALFFAALLFVIRKFVKKKTGYTEEKNEKAIEEGNDVETENVDEMSNDEEGNYPVEDPKEVTEESDGQVEEPEEITEEFDDKNEIPNEEVEEESDETEEIEL